MMSRLPNAESGRYLCHQQIRCIINGNIPPLLIDDLTSPPVSSMTDLSTNKRNASHDLMICYSSMSTVVTMLLFA
jgi:hypothetical protein